MYKETGLRSILKTLSWRLWATLITATIVYLFTGRLDVAAAVGGIDLLVKLFLYYLHERIWNNVNYGKKEVVSRVFWFTGLSGAGKSTLAEALYAELKKKGYKTEHLDGDNVRHIFPKTGFTKEERDRHIRRVGFLASKLENNGVFVTASFISPYKESRDFVRKLCRNFVEIYVATSLEVCEQRDIKGLYAKARAGEINHFTGINDPYEIPENPEIIIDTSKESINQSIKRILQYIDKK
ncbi:MAG: adenylyl-sulfate kinase [Chlorobi bacterium]|nr:adenylyl-sulfate kinase [Chlorobiota bacterium]